MAKRRMLRLRDLVDEPLIIFDRHFSSGLYDRILDLYRQQGLSPSLTITHTETHEEAGKVMVASGRGIFIGVGAMVTTSLSGVDLAAVRLNEPGAKIETLLAWRKDEKSAAVFAFLDSARRLFRRAEHN
jgi:DNA-binding transcriptional LysR family regulator